MRGVLITGASSGIGAALAVEAARRGVQALFLCGRDEERLQRVAADAESAGASDVSTAVLDVTDEDAVRDWIRSCDARTPLDVVFANAGRSTGLEDEASVRRTFAVNIGGVVNTVLPAIEIFRARADRSVPPHVVITSSIAGYAPLSACPSYAGTKACVKSWGLSLRGMLAREGIRVNVVCPGFVRSRITDRNTCPMPFFMEADRAARIIWNRVARDVGLIAFPLPMRLAVWSLSLLPWRLAEFIARLLPRKNGRAAPPSA